jgi:exodeoxyribonuclease VII small subunit
MSIRENKNQEADASFEKLVKRLSVIVEQLDSDKMPLEKSIALFEEGQKIASECLEELNKVKARIDEVKKEDILGKIKTLRREEIEYDRTSD